MSAAAVAVPIVLILVAAIVIGILLIFGYVFYRSKYHGVAYNKCTCT